MLKYQYEDLINEYIKIRSPKAKLSELVDKLTEMFDDRMDHHDALIVKESEAEAREALIGSAVKELNGIIDRLDTGIRDKPSVCRRLFD